MKGCMKNCSNCKHRDKFLTEEPCFSCKYTEEWEPADTEFDPTEEDNNENLNQDTV